MKTRDNFSARTKEESINRTNLSLAATTLVKSALLSGALLAFAPGVACAEQMAKKGTTPYVTHFIFRPLMSIGITGSEPFACITMPALAGPGGYTAMDIPHNTTWEIK